MAKAKTNQDKITMPKDYKLIKAIQNDKLYKANTKRRDKKARGILETSSPKAAPSKMKIGSLYLMEYFEPSLIEELEYYDAKPCSIFFGRCKNKEGKKRIIGFNIHYFPPRIRFQVLDRVMSIFEPFYKKMWSNKDPKDLAYFDYKMLVWQLQRAKLDFGVRMYIPELVGKCQLIEPKDWQKAVFTEGWFKKRTREAIMRYWQNRLVDKQLNRRAKKAGIKKTAQMATNVKLK